MSLIAKLIGVEWIKLRKSTVFWAVMLVPAMVLIITLGGEQYMHHAQPTKADAFTIPGGWSHLIMIASQLGMLMLYIGVAGLVASEATWRTRRQNVIDGLSRGQYFAAKFVVVMMLALLLWVVAIVLGIAMAPVGGAGALTWPWFPPLARSLLPHVLLYFAAIGTIAFMFAMLASSSGAAIALMFAYLIIEPILGALMSSQGGYWPTIARYLPLGVFGNLTSRASYDAAIRASQVATYQRFGRPLPLTLGTSTLLTLVYIGVFIGITWMAFRKRDL